MPNVFLSGSATNTSISGSVGPAASVVIVNPNAARMSLDIVNDGASAVYLSLGKVAVAGNGIRLNSSGGSFEINSTNLYTGTVTAITLSGTTSLTIMEMLTQ
jgi:hypothetical protein